MLRATEKLGSHPKGGNSLKSPQEIRTRSNAHGSIYQRRAANIFTSCRVPGRPRWALGAFFRAPSVLKMLDDTADDRAVINDRGPRCRRLGYVTNFARCGSASALSASAPLSDRPSATVRLVGDLPQDRVGERAQPGRHSLRLRLDHRSELNIGSAAFHVRSK
jgi:hypothetical protein